MAKNKEVLTISLRYVPVLVKNPNNSSEDWLLDLAAIEVTPDPAFMDDQKHFKKIEWVTLNHPDDKLTWTITKKNYHSIATIGINQNSTGPIAGLVPFHGVRNYTVQVTGTNRWGYGVNLTKDPEIHWGRRG